jgi:hypothetical protein
MYSKHRICWDNLRDFDSNLYWKLYKYLKIQSIGQSAEIVLSHKLIWKALTDYQCVSLFRDNGIVDSL